MGAVAGAEHAGGVPTIFVPHVLTPLSPLTPHPSPHSPPPQVLRLTILCLTWDSPESDAAVHLWAALAQMCSSLLRTALASCEGGGGGGAEEGTAPFVPHAAQVRGGGG